MSYYTSKHKVSFHPRFLYNNTPNAAPATAKKLTNPRLAGCSPPAAFVFVGGAVEVELGEPVPEAVGDAVPEGEPLLLFSASDAFHLPTIQSVASSV